MTDDKKLEVRRLILYIALTFLLTYAFEYFLCTRFMEFFQLGAMAAMWIPGCVTAIVCRGLTEKRSGIKWRPNIKKNARWLFFSWFTPTFLTVLGAFVFFTRFPKDFSSEMPGLISMFTEQGIDVSDGTIQGLSLTAFAAIQAAGAIIIAPFVNIIPALGEEIGWRGYMTPALQRLTGKRLGLIISGVIWGLWHAPLIVLAGYEYGTDYFGAPWLGVIAFCYITTLIGIILSYFYDRSGSILFPALCHGAFNAIAALPLLFTTNEYGPMILGPAPQGVLGALPMLVIAVVLFIYYEPKKHNNIAEQNTEE